MIFSEATNEQAFLKLGIFGFTGSGKTYTATDIAIGLNKELISAGLPVAPVFFLDTETGSDWAKRQLDKAGVTMVRSKTRAFVDLCPAIREAENGHGILIIDSITHFWRELMESYAKKKNRKKLRFDDWSELKMIWGDFTDEFVNSQCHIIMCGRAGFEYDWFDEDGKKELEKTGIKMKAETETGYEPNILVLMTRHQDISTDPITVWRTATVLKDRSTLLDGRVFKNPTYANFKPHIDCLNLGGEHVGVDTSHNSQGLIAKDVSNWQYEKQQAEITLDEIQALLVKHFPSQSGQDKTAKGALLDEHFKSRSWERIKTYPYNDLRACYNALHAAIEGKPADFSQPTDEPFTNPQEQPA